MALHVAKKVGTSSHINIIFIIIIFDTKLMQLESNIKNLLLRLASYTTNFSMLASIIAWDPGLLRRGEKECLVPHAISMIFVY